MPSFVNMITHEEGLRALTKLWQFGHWVSRSSQRMDSYLQDWLLKVWFLICPWILKNQSFKTQSCKIHSCILYVCIQDAAVRPRGSGLRPPPPRVVNRIGLVLACLGRGRTAESWTQPYKMHECIVKDCVLKDSVLNIHGHIKNQSFKNQSCAGRTSRQKEANVCL